MPESPAPAAGTAKLRLSLGYVLLFGVTGVSLPYAGLWMKDRGLSGAEIGVLLAVPMLARLITGPVLAVWADGFVRRRTPIACLAAAAAAGYGGALFVDGFGPWMVCWFVGATAAAALLPLSDVLTLRLARREGFTFALPRGFGSAAFVAANVVMGAILARAPSQAVGVWIACGAAALAVFALVGLPGEPVADGVRTRARDRFRGLGALLGSAPFVGAVAATAALHASHAFYYAFSAVLWTAQGLGATVTGALWGFAVIVEIAFMWVVEPWRRRAGISPWTLILIAAAAGALRWAALTTEPGLGWLVALQALHALSFAASYLAGLELVDRFSPPDSHTAAQTLSSALSSGVVIGLATLISGPLYDAHGAQGYWAMVALAVAGGAVAAGMRRRAPV
ncbi:MAG: MFS transporter [Alphaproteobacteria bacterium]|nr:MFS transporter [Alphaproteobacteria bacterium]MBU1527495.1 MFS transporter [Alphaproteobacteria bacterium]MBU2352635.1 MFS transporter [Alphaproteobacteria bacterium]MBU2383010.1 MFS transporter [Alphaproteobacteria bacterium]